MPFLLTKPPVDAKAVLLAELATLRKKTRAARALRGVDAIAVPQTVYQVSPLALASGNGLESAQHTGYRYLLLKKGAPIATLELTVENGVPVPRFAGFSTGPLVRGTEAALLRAEKALAKKQGSLEVHVVDVMAMDFNVLWLRGPTPAESFVTAITPVPSLKTSKVYSVEAFHQAIKAPAERYIQDVDDARKQQKIH